MRIIHKIIEKLVSLLFESSIPKPTGRYINMWEHSVWGNNICFADYDKGRKINKIVGWLSIKPVVGDEIRSKMQSGKIARYLVVSVDYCRDPQDMFFADVGTLGYLDGDPEPEVHDKEWGFL